MRLSLLCGLLTLCAAGCAGLGGKGPADSGNERIVPVNGELSVRFITDGVTNVFTVPLIAGRAERPYDAELVYPCGDGVMTNGLGVMISARVTAKHYSEKGWMYFPSSDSGVMFSCEDLSLYLTVSRREFAFWSKPAPARNGRRDPFFHIDAMTDVVHLVPDLWSPLGALTSIEKSLGSGERHSTAIDFRVHLDDKGVASQQ